MSKIRPVLVGSDWTFNRPVKAIILEYPVVRDFLVFEPLAYNASYLFFFPRAPASRINMEGFLNIFYTNQRICIFTLQWANHHGRGFGLLSIQIN